MSAIHGSIPINSTTRLDEHDAATADLSYDDGEFRAAAACPRATITPEFDALHALSSPDDVTPFQLFATEDGEIALRGEIDVFTCPAFERILSRVPESLTGHVVVDMAALEFVDHRALLALERFAERAGTTLSLRAAPAVVRRLMELVDFEHVRLDDPA